MGGEVPHVNLKFFGDYQRTFAEVQGPTLHAAYLLHGCAYLSEQARAPSTC